jgi:superoxide dismutase, Fe-Mn family
MIHTRTLFLIGASLITVGILLYSRKEHAQSDHYPFRLPALPYAYDALEPYIDTQTMKIHHDLHHQAYINGLNEALKEHPELQKKTVTELLQELNTLPEPLRVAVRNFGGGHANHSLFWTLLTPTSTKEPVGQLKEALIKQFGSFEEFKKQFDKAAMSVFGSGWAWLVIDPSGTLKIVTTPNQESPLSDGLVPLLCLDVWEHAYYLKYQNKRRDYTDAWWNVVHWTEVEKNFEKATKK